MAADLKNLEKLPPKIRDSTAGYVMQLVAAYEQRLLSVLVYGSAITGDYVPGKSNVNIALVVDRVDVDTLKRALGIVAKGRRKKIVAPLFLTKSFIERSSDVFPLEFLEIKEHHVLLYGEDVFSDLEIGISNLRLQCEEQLKGSLLRLRQAYLELGSSKKGIEALLVDSLTSLIPVMRGMLRLKGLGVPGTKEEVLRMTSEVFEADLETLLAILKDKRGDEKISGEDAEVVLSRYMECVRELGVKVDRL